MRKNYTEINKEVEESDLLFANVLVSRRVDGFGYPNQMTSSRLAELSVGCALLKAAEANVHF